MRKLIDSKIFWMVISFLLSLSIWVYVTSVEAVETTKTFQIPVELVGQETLRSVYTLVVTDVDTNMVTVEISGPRRIVNSLDNSMLTAQVDVSRITQAGYNSVNYEIVYPSGTERRSLSVVSRSKDTISFWVSKYITDSFPVVGGFTGTAAQGFNLNQNGILFEPNTITVSGPSKYVNLVDHAYVSFGKGEVVSSTYSQTVNFVLMDADNNPVDTTEITFTPETIRATQIVYATKTVTLDVNRVYDDSATEENVRVTIVPESIVLYGDTADLEGLNQIMLDTIDFSKFGTSYTYEYTIPVPNGITYASDQVATVTIEVLGSLTRNVQLEQDQVVFMGLDDDAEVEILSDEIPLLLRGPERVIRLLNVKNIHCEVDLTEYQGYRGTLLVPFRIEVVGFTNVSAVAEDGLPEYTLLINLKDKTALETEEPEESP